MIAPRMRSLPSVKHSVHIVKMIKDQSFAFNVQGFLLAFLGMIQLSLEQIEPLLIMARQIQLSLAQLEPLLIRPRQIQLSLLEVVE